MVWESNGIGGTNPTWIQAATSENAVVSIVESGLCEGLFGKNQILNSFCGKPAVLPVRYSDQLLSLSKMKDTIFTGKSELLDDDNKTI